MDRPVQIYKWRGTKKEPYLSGTFHRWGENFEEFEHGAVGFTVAIVELPNGEIITSAAEFIRFCDR